GHEYDSNLSIGEADDVTSVPRDPSAMLDHLRASVFVNVQTKRITVGVTVIEHPAFVHLLKNSWAAHLPMVKVVDPLGEVSNGGVEACATHQRCVEEGVFERVTCNRPV